MDAEQGQIEAGRLAVTKDRLKAWSACSDGYRWFLERFPQGGQFAEVHAALNTDKRYDDAGWLVERVFAELETGDRVRQTVLISGADEAKITGLAKDGGPDAAATTGNWANAATTGYRANAATTGDRANAATTGYRANAATTGDRANAATTGEGANAATTGEGAIAASLGASARAKAGVGGAIVLARRDPDTGRLLGVFAALVGQSGIKPDTWYEIDEEGKPVEAEA